MGDTPHGPLRAEESSEDGTARPGTTRPARPARTSDGVSLPMVTNRRSVGDMLLINWPVRVDPYTGDEIVDRAGLAWLGKQKDHG